MKKLLLFLLLAAGIASAVTNTVVVEPSPYGSFTGHAPGVYTYTTSHAFPFVANTGYSAVATLNGNVVTGSTVAVTIGLTNGYYRVGVKAYYIKIEDTVWSKQVNMPAGTYYKVGTGIWTQVIWTDKNSEFGAGTINGVSTSPTASPLKYFIPPPTNTNNTFVAVKKSNNVTLSENADCCMFSPTNGTYAVSGNAYKFKVIPKDGYGVKVTLNASTNVLGIVSEPTEFTIPVKGSTTVTAYRNSVTMTIEGGPFAQAPCNTSTIYSSQTQPKTVTVAPATGYTIYKTYMDGEAIGGAGTYVIPTDKDHTLTVTPVTITVGANPVGSESPVAGVYTNGVSSFSYACSITNTAFSFDGVYFNGEKLTATGGVYTVKAVRPSYLGVKSNKTAPSQPLDGAVRSVTFTASGSWQYVSFADPGNFDPTTGEKLLPHYGDAIMIQSFGGDIDIAESTNMVMTLYTKTAPYNLTLSPITVPDGNSLVINKQLKGVWFKGSGDITISTVQR